MADKENATRRSYASLQLQRKQQAAAAADVGVSLPRVARVAAAGPVGRAGSAASQRSPLRDSKPARPPSSLGSSLAQHHLKPPCVSVPRMGFKPATHSTRTLAPLLDAMAPARGAPAPTPASAGSSIPPPIPAISPVSASPLASTIGDPTLDDAEAALQAELALADRRLEVLQSQQLHRRSVTPEAEPLPAGGAPMACALTPPMQPAAQHLEASPPQQAQQLQQLAAVDDLLPPEPAQEAPPIPPDEQSIVRSVTAATGTGCRDVMAAHTGAGLPHGTCWTTRGHRVLHLESSCILQLWGRRITDITLRITFADAASVPRLVRLEHAPSHTAAFERLGDIMLQPKSLKQLRHLFRLGKNLEVQRFLRITLVGHMAEVHSGAHRVSHILLTSGQGPQRTQSALSGATAAGASCSAASVQASVNHGRQQGQPLADSAASGTPAAAAAASTEVDVCSSAAAIGMPPIPATSNAAQVPVPADACSLASAVALAPVAPSGLQEPAHAVDATASAAPSCAGSSTSGSSGDGEEQHAPKAAQPAAEQGTCPQAAWGTLEDAGPADVDFAELAAEFGGSSAGPPPVPPPPPQQQQVAKERQGREAQPAAPAASAAMVMLLPMQRCSDVQAILSRLGMSPKQAFSALLQFVEWSSEGLGLSAEQLGDLLHCLPSLEEQALLRGFEGLASQLVAAEQLMLELAQVPAVAERVEARRFAALAAPRIEAAAADAAALGAACAEVAQSDLLRSLLKTALLTANFLSAGNQKGGAPGFQIDALLKLKDVRSSRARSRTLLHFVAREVARQHPEGACLRVALPSAAAAADVDVGATRADLLELRAGSGRVETALAAALKGSTNAGALAQLGAFRSGVAERLEGLLQALDDSEAAFRHLGSFINAQKATLADPKAFFGVLHAFAQELAGAHQENAAADVAARQSVGQGKDGKPRRQGEACSSSGCASASLGLPERGRQGSAGSREGNASAAGCQAEQSQPKAAAALERLRQASLDRLAGAGSEPPDNVRTSMASMAAMCQRKQHSPQPCMSKAALAGIGGSRRGASSSPGSSDGRPGSAAVSPPAFSRVDAAALLARASSPCPDVPASDAPAKVSTPVAALLAESARIISSIDAGQGGTSGSTFGGAAAGAAPEDGRAATPDGAVCAAGTAAEEAAAGFSTPRENAVSLHWLKQQQPKPAAEQQVAGAGQLLRYRAAATPEEEGEVAAVAPTATMPAEPLLASQAALLPVRAPQHAASFSQLRQRSLQQLSPTSTPLSSLGRQSSRGSACSEDSLTPRSSLRAARSSQLQRSVSPLGAGPAAVEAEAHPAMAANSSAAALLGGQRARPLEADASSHPQQAEELPDKGNRYPAVGQAERLPDQAPEEPALPAREFGASALHSRASSCDLTYYAPFSMDREGPGAFAASDAQASQRLSASFCYGQEPASAWGPLAAQQERLQSGQAGRLMRHTSADEGMLAAAAAATQPAHGTQRAAVSLPSSPRQGVDAPGASRRPPPLLSLHSVSARLQLSAQRATSAAPGGQGQLPASNRGSTDGAAHRQQPRLSPVAEALLAPSPTFAPAAHQGQAELAADDLADLAGFSSDHEAEWQQLERMEQLDAEWHRELEAERAARELLLLQPALGQRGTAQQQRAGQQGDEAAQTAAPQPLPSPINSGTVDLDAAMARLLASAGNTPTGPLGLGLRSAPADVPGAAATEQARRSAGAASAAGGGRQVALLEPLVPAPLGEGVRASDMLSENVPAAALRLSVEGPRAMLRQQQPAPCLTEEAEYWAAAAAAAGGAKIPSSSGILASGGAGCRGGTNDWGAGMAGVGPIRRRRGLGRFLPKGASHDHPDK